MMNSHIDLMLNEAFTAYNTGNYERAENLAREVISAESANGDAIYLLGLIAYQAGALEPAADLLFQAVKLYPNIINYDLTLASVLHRQGHLDEALSRYEKYPEHPQAVTQRGWIYFQKRLLDFAKSAFEKALRLSPNLAEARLGLALLKDDKISLQQLAKETHLPDAWYYLAKQKRAEHHFKQALAAIEASGLGQGAYQLEKGLILEEMGHWSEALQVYRQALRKYPNDSDIWANLGNVLRRMKDFSAAEDAYKRALAQNSDHLAARHNLADLMYTENRLSESLEEYRVLLSRHPEYAPSLYNLAIILEKQGEYAEAAGLYVRLLLKPDCPKGVEWRLADTLSALAESDTKLATTFAKGWVKHYPNNPVAQHILAALTGTKEKDTLAYTQKLYDDFSESYDATMRHIKAIAAKNMAGLMPIRTYAKALDLGCGTGAWGRVFGKKVTHLTGVDLSERMLRLATRTKAYHSLVRRDICAYLEGIKTRFDLITAIEVLEYLPDVKGVLPLVVQHLKSDGLFAFSVETGPGDKPKLAVNGRYLYPEQYMRDCLNKFGLKILKQKEISLRKEGHGVAAGMLFVTGRDRPEK